jgi:restriction system protein
VTTLYFSYALCAIVAAIITSLLHADMATFICFSIGALFVLLGSVSMVRDGRAKEATRSYIDAQARVFARRRAQLVSVDDYGVEDTSRWEKEKNYILSRVIPDHLAKTGHSRSAIGSLSWSSSRPFLERIEKAATREANQIPLVSLENVASGIDYEKFCAEILRRAGWNTRVTKATGDQGTDIIAEMAGHRVILQCKFYTSPVGNKAVQEAVAARLHERADNAVVVSNASYTKAARRLAATTGVLLLHHDELETLIKRL